MGYASNLNLAIFPRVLLTAAERAGIWLLKLATVLAIYPRRSYLFSFFVTILMAQLSMKFPNRTFRDVLDLYSAQRSTYT